MPKKTPKSSSTSDATAESPPIPGPLSSLLHGPMTASPTSPTTSAFIASPTHPETSDETAERVIRHMNADHTDSLGRYLAHFGRVWAISARRPKLVRLSRENMTIASTGPVGAEGARGLHTTISFEPKLAEGMTDVRQRLIDMDREATTALKRKDVTVKKYAWPKGWVWGWWAFVTLAWLVFSRRQNFFEGSFFFEGVLKWLPKQYIVWLRMWQPRIRLVIFGLHGLETMEMVTGKLRSYNVDMLSGVWWAWTLSVFFEGFTVWDRLDRVVKEEEESKKRTMH